MNAEVIDFILKQILPIVISIGSVGYKIYYDVRQLNHQVAANKTEIAGAITMLGTEIKEINASIGKFEVSLAKNKTADEFRDREVKRLDEEIKVIKSKIYNGGSK